MSDQENKKVIEKVKDYISEHQSFVGRGITGAAIVIMITLVIASNSSTNTSDNMGNITSNSTEVTKSSSEKNSSTDDRISELEEESNENVTASEVKNDTESKIEDDSTTINNGVENSDDTAESLEIDGFDIIGIDYREVEGIPGNRIDNRMRNTCYFEICDITCTFVEKTSLINSVETGSSSAISNGNNTKKLPIMGICPGDNIDDVKESLEKMGLDIIELNDGSFMCSFLLEEDKQHTYELKVDFSNDTVSHIHLVEKINKAKKKSASKE